MLIADAARDAGHTAARRRLPRRDAEGRVEGGGTGSSRSIPTISTRAARWSSRSRCASCAGAAISSSARRRTGSCARTPASTCRTSSDGWAALLPVDSDRSAKHIRDALRARAGVDVAVIVSDTFGRPWRHGLTDVAIGVSGIAAVVDLRETPDGKGRLLHVTEVAIADEIAAAAELVMGKAAGRSRRDRARARRSHGDATGRCAS